MMFAVPGDAIRVLEIEAVRIALVPNVVETGAPFQWTTEEVVNPPPFTKRLNALPPATVLLNPKMFAVCVDFFRVSMVRPRRA